MKDTPEDITALQRLVESSIERAGPYLRESFQMPGHSLSARQFVAHLRSETTVALATVTSRGEPRVAPVGAFFVRGRFMIPTLRTSARCSHVLRNPAISLSYYEGNDLAVIVHGSARCFGSEAPEFMEADALQRELTKSSVTQWGRPSDAVFLRVDAVRFYTFARYPERFPETV